MRQGAGTRRKPVKKPRRKSAKPRRAPKVHRSSPTSARDLQEQVAALTRELKEAREQQTATADVLKIISSSPGELKLVFDAMLENAALICDAHFGVLFLVENGLVRPASKLNVPRKLEEFFAARRTFLPPEGSLLRRTLDTKQLIHVADDAASPNPSPAATLGGARTNLTVPMLKDGDLVGAIAIFRQEVHPFTDKQIELIQNFAAQAVIAIENTRLLNELRQRTDDLSESLEQQTATSEVLKVISSSPGELKPVFNAMLANAARICEAKFGILYLAETDGVRAVAMHDVPPAFAEGRRERLMHPPSDTAIGQALNTKRAVQVDDVRKERGYVNRDPMVVESIDQGGMRTVAAVPMLKEENLIGAIVIYRQEVKLFTEKQIELLQNFAAQAVIAIENTRLLSELRESLQQQTATSEVLSVISRSPGDLQPVFSAILDNATRICEAKFANLFLYEDNSFRIAATQNAPAAYAERWSHYPVLRIADSPRNPLARLAQSKAVVNILDLTTEPGYIEGDPRFVSLVDAAGARSLLSVPLLKDNELVGAITIYRQEIRPFNEQQLELVQDFAAQAVIAIENTRLLNELRESLQQQTATAEVLQVISSSPGELQPVFTAMLENVVRICDAKFGTLYLFGDEGLTIAATHNVPPAFEAARKRGPIQPHPDTSLGGVIRTKRVTQIEDLMTTRGYAERDPAVVDAVELGGMRTVAAVPMLKDDRLVGVIAIFRQEVRLFSDKQIALLRNFAAQAVIAIENARLLNELRESLQQQTATADVLKVISRSAFDLQTVLNALVRSALRLCEADMGAIHKQQGRGYQEIATQGFPADYGAFLEKNMPFEAAEGSVLGRTVKQRHPIQVEDVLADPNYTFVEGQKRAGFRTVLGVPLIREGTPLGAMVLMRKAVKPFTAKQIELVTTFADQAVIAIENVRLFDEIQDKSRQLAEASQHKSQFLANMSHELRTPLNAILGYTELLADSVYGAMPEKALGVLKRLESNGKHLLGLINDVLDLSKIEAGQLKLDLAEYSIQDVAQTVYGAVEPLAADKKLSFKCEVAPNLPAGYGDGRRLTQVLLNLVGNAIKFTDIGEVVIKANASNGSFNLSVRDTGPGISEADQAKLFQEFQQADNSITRKKGGTGLGLAISKRIVEMHGGKIWLESLVGQGSTFFIAFPVKVEQQKIIEGDDEHQPSPR